MNTSFVDEKTGIPYTLVGDYYLPWGDLPDDNNENEAIGVWGERRKHYLREHQNWLYAELLAHGALYDHLVEIDSQAHEMFSRLVDEMAQSDGVTEKFKAENQMKWVGKMNNIRQRAREIVSCELIHR